MKIRRSEERGKFDFGWLKTYHTFSFGDYFDRNHMHFSDLRVINHDFVAPATGFPTHPHKDMEIITYILKGVVEHQDSMGNKAQIQTGEVQTMSAGTGVLHSEYNPSQTEELELIQIWVMPRIKGGNPSYAQKKFPLEDRKNKFLKIISSEAKEGALPIKQDADIFASIIQGSKPISFELRADKQYWLQVVQGQLTIEFLQNKEVLKKGDAISIEAEEISANGGASLQFQSDQFSEVLLFELSSYQ